MSTDTKKKLLKALKNNAVHVTFIKKDGTERKMLCTRDWRTINKYAEEFGFIVPKEGSPLPDDGPMIRVWDIGKTAWRCVNTETVTEFHIDD